MTSVIRIKRSLNQEPAEALVVATKRAKLDVQETENIVFKFCGTTQNEKENPEIIKKFLKTSRQETFRSKAGKSSVKRQPSSSDKKYKFLESRRFDSDENLKVYDCVEEDYAVGCDRVTCNGIPLVVEKCNTAEEDKYAYDYYSCPGGLIDEAYIDGLLSVQPYFYADGDKEDEEVADDDDDSNDENNYRNDYPDTDEDENDTEEDLVGRITGMYLDNNSDLSSEEEAYIYSKEDDEPCYSDAYTAYKKRVTKSLATDGSDYSESDEEDDEDEEDPEGSD